MVNRKRILLVLPRMNGGGTERVASILANHLCDDYDVAILVLVSNESFYPLKPKVQFISAMFDVNRKTKMTRMFSLGRNFLQAISFVRSKIKAMQPDIVFSLLEETDIVTYLALRGNRQIPHICSERNDPTTRNKTVQRLLNYIYKKCNYLVCQSRTVAQYYTQVPAARKCVIPNPVDFTAYPERADESLPPRIVGVGRLKPQKNFQLLIESFALIADQYPGVSLTIYGEGSLREELQQQINERHLERRVALPGASKQVLMEMRDAAIYIMSSDYEGFPNTLVEAIAMGVPVISTDFATGIAREIITDQIGCVVPCRDQAALAKAMRALLDDPAQRRQIRESGCKSIEQFDTAHVVQMWDDLLRQIIF